MKKIQGLVDTFEKDNDNAKNIIKRFDEIILEKASKFNLEELKLEMKRYIHSDNFGRFLINLKEHQSSTNSSISSLSQKVENLEGEIQEVIDKKMEKSLVEVKKKVFGNFQIDV